MSLVDTLIHQFCLRFDLLGTSPDLLLLLPQARVQLTLSQLPASSQNEEFTPDCTISHMRGGCLPELQASWSVLQQGGGQADTQQSTAAAVTMVGESFVAASCFTRSSQWSLS
jgi:hypothetical protein